MGAAKYLNLWQHKLVTKFDENSVCPMFYSGYTSSVLFSWWQVFSSEQASDTFFFNNCAEICWFEVLALSKVTQQLTMITSRTNSKKMMTIIIWSRFLKFGTRSSSSSSGCENSDIYRNGRKLSTFSWKQAENSQIGRDDSELKTRLRFLKNIGFWKKF